MKKLWCCNENLLLWWKSIIVMKFYHCDEIYHLDSMWSSHRPGTLCFTKFGSIWSFINIVLLIILMKFIKSSSSFWWWFTIVMKMCRSLINPFSYLLKCIWWGSIYTNSNTIYSTKRSFNTLHNHEKLSVITKSSAERWHF